MEVVVSVSTNTWKWWSLKLTVWLEFVWEQMTVKLAFLNSIVFCCVFPYDFPS